MSLSPAPFEPGAAWMLVPASRERFDGIRDYAAHLAGALRAHEPVLCITTRDDAAVPEDWRALGSWRELAATGAAPRVLYFNYQPASWLRRDLSSLLRAIDGLRAHGTRVIVVFHEYQLDPAPGLRRAVARTVFRRLAAAVARRADALVATYGFVAAGLADDGLGRHAPIEIVPVGSNIPVAGGARAGSEEPVVMFGQPAGMSAAFVRAAASALARERRPPARWLCRSRDEAERWLADNDVPRGGVTLCAGLDAREVSATLASAQVAFAPVIDGVSTRRTTVAACLQHGLPIVGSRGRATDAVFGDSAAFSLAGLDAPADGAARLLDVLGDGAARTAMALEARRLFDGTLAWPRIASRFVGLAA